MADDKTYLSIEIPPKVKQQLRIAAAMRDANISELVRQLIDDYLAQVSENIPAGMDAIQLEVRGKS